jgi:hypothetical protein
MIDKDSMRKWAAEFKRNHSCISCPFVKNEVDIGVGIQRDCDGVCTMEVDEIVKEMEGYSVEI